MADILILRPIHTLRIAQLQDPRHLMSSAANRDDTEWNVAVRRGQDVVVVADAVAVICTLPRYVRNWESKGQLAQKQKCWIGLYHGSRV